MNFNSQSSSSSAPTTLIFIVSLLIFLLGLVFIVIGFTHQRPLLIPASLLLPCGFASGVATYCKIRHELRQNGGGGGGGHDKEGCHDDQEKHIKSSFADRSSLATQLLVSGQPVPVQFDLLSIDPLMRRPMTSLQYRSCSDTRGKIPAVNVMTSRAEFCRRDGAAADDVKLSSEADDEIVRPARRCSYQILSPAMVIAIASDDDNSHPLDVATDLNAC